MGLHLNTQCLCSSCREPASFSSAAFRRESTVFRKMIVQDYAELKLPLCEPLSAWQNQFSNIAEGRKKKA